MKELIEEAGRWDLESARASLWWSSTYDDEIKEDMAIKTQKGQRIIPFEKIQNSGVHLYFISQITRRRRRNSVFSFGCDNWSWSRKAMEKIKGSETKMMRKLFKFRWKDDLTVTQYCRRTARMSKTIWKKMELPFLFWRAVGWVCDQNPNAVLRPARSWPPNH